MSPPCLDVREQPGAETPEDSINLSSRTQCRVSVVGWSLKTKTADGGSAARALRIRVNMTDVMEDNRVMSVIIS